MRFTPAMISVAIAIGAMSVGRAFATADPGQLEARQSTRCITPLVACTTNTTCASCATFPPVIPSWTCRTVPGSSQGANSSLSIWSDGAGGVQRTQAISLERAQRRNGSWDTAPERNAPLFFEDLTAEVPAAAKLLNGVEGPSRLCSYLQGAVLGVVLAMLWTSFLDDTQDPSAPRVNDRSSRKRRKVDAVGPPLAMLPNTYNDDDAQPGCNFSATMSLRILHCAGSSDSSKKEGVSGGSVSGTVMLAFGRSDAVLRLYCTGQGHSFHPDNIHRHSDTSRDLKSSSSRRTLHLKRESRFTVSGYRLDPSQRQSRELLFDIERYARLIGRTIRTGPGYGWDIVSLCGRSNCTAQNWLDLGAARISYLRILSHVPQDAVHPLLAGLASAR
ncbi:hypothetical protein BD310DRAFT_910584 [Dichomitus squalens]|uniref:Uncharacterized protein n=1 Tax=Dichomitus squalens TaxID=114155 RepID=A0A4Q9PA96_9APHY|nr:hypothetical protein BD310DRAFT_910584 [Dichomitus squalens]